MLNIVGNVKASSGTLYATVVLKSWSSSLQHSVILPTMLFKTNQGLHTNQDAKYLLFRSYEA